RVVRKVRASPGRQITPLQTDTSSVSHANTYQKSMQIAWLQVAFDVIKMEPLEEFESPTC
ncbi:MAG: hypothetical protein J5674_06440, partial [Candidatus Methanomethylophilaceae archaeon]|nr:hypothetical protein [Candidatus Methanomethylophilaceae archaeon]